MAILGLPMSMEVKLPAEATPTMPALSRVGLLMSNEGRVRAKAMPESMTSLWTRLDPLVRGEVWHPIQYLPTHAV